MLLIKFTPFQQLSETTQQTMGMSQLVINSIATILIPIVIEVLREVFLFIRQKQETKNLVSKIERLNNNLKKVKQQTEQLIQEENKKILQELSELKDKQKIILDILKQNKNKYPLVS